MKKRLLAMLLCVAIVASMLTVGAAAEEGDTSGTCGDNLTWSLDSDGTLTISGSGDMWDYSHYGTPRNPAPWVTMGQWNWENNTINKVVIGEGVTSVGDEAFQYCNVISEVEFPSTLKTIGEAAFVGNQLRELNLPTGLESIGDYAFELSWYLESVTLPDGLKSIGYGAFGSAVELNKAIVPASVTEIGLGAFGTLETAGPIGSGCELEFGWTTSIPDNAFGGSGADNDQYSSFTSIILPDTITSIGDDAFRASQDLKYIKIPDGVKSIGARAFWWSGIESIDLPAGLETIGVAAFSQCESLSSIDLPDSLQRIEDKAFEYCVNLSSVQIPENVSYIGPSAFAVQEWNEELEGKRIYFEGNAPICTDSGDTGSFPSDATLYYTDGTSGWLDSENYDPDTGLWRGYKLVVLDSSHTPQIVEFSPANGATISETASTDFKVTYDTPISATETTWGNYVDLDFSKGSIEIHRMSDDYVIYTVEANDFLNEYFNIEGTYSTDIKVENGNTLVFSPFNVHTLFDSGAEYYITIDEGVFSFENGMSNPEIKKGDWTFSTGQGTFKFLASDGTKDLEYTFDFTEDYFNVNSYYYNHDLAKTSLALALSAFNSYDAQRYGYDKSVAAKNVIAMLRDMGFEDINVDSYEGKPTANSIAQAIGHKSINIRGLEYTVLAVAIRGGGYEAEWSNNFQVGSDRHHIGFDSSATTVVSEIIDYIENELIDKEKENLKIWITGYSRGAAVANLTGHKINTLINNSTFDSLNMGIGDVYVYTFATPMGAAGERTSPKETNIYNIVNPVDVVPKLAPSAWGFYRYGVTYMLPSQETDSKLFDANKAKAMDIAGNLTGKITTKAFTWQGSALDSMLDAFDLMEPDGSISMTLQNTLAEHFEDKYRGGSGGVGLFGIIKDIWSTGSTTKAWLTLDFASLAKTYLLKPAVLDGAAETLDQVLSTVEMAHYPETYLAWMYALDAEEFGHGIYRKDYINCPVDVTVYDENGNNVAGFKDEEPYFEADGYVTAYVDENEQKVLVFPNDREYRVEITPYDSGTLSYTVEEYSAADNETRRVVSYQRIPIEVGDKFEGVVSAITDTESETIYTFSKNEDGELEPTVDQSGNEVEKLTVNVSVTGNGQANGGGTFLNGEYALLTATPNIGSSFTGWYTDSNLLSTETELRILVDEDKYITAAFTNGGNIPSVDVPSNQPEEPEEPTDSLPFTDVSVSDWFYDYVAYVYANGLMDGVSDTQFAPNGTMTRAMVWAILARIDGETVTGESWIETARAWAMAEGVSDGTDANGLVTREQFATMLWRYAGEPASDYSLSAYTDASGVSDWAQTAMCWAVENGIITGVTATTIVPQGTATRAQAAAMLMRFIENIG